MSSVIAAVDTINKSTKTSLNPRATLFGMKLLWSIPTHPKDFAVWSINANEVFPFRPFIGEIIKDHKGGLLHTNERMPSEQVTDLVNTQMHFLELTELAKLEDEEKADRVAAVLYSPRDCSKYKYELKNTCATCWVDYLRTEAADRIAEELKGEPQLQRAAHKTVEQLLPALVSALTDAKAKVDATMKEIDEPGGKTAFNEYDLLNTYHVHGDPPKYKTSTSNQDIGQVIADALRGIAKPKYDVPAFDPADLTKLVRDAVAEETAELRAKLQKYETVDEPDVNTPVVSDEVIAESTKGKTAKK